MYQQPFELVSIKVDQVVQNFMDLIMSNEDGFDMFLCMDHIVMAAVIFL